ncbi:MAG TPA: NAD(P)/FAD-dependent oxidoreductase [Spirochaetes bacterium]|nr:NAD(P)/FAD-dependent oxidoreductase [Spirochaetota bacterium]
MEKSSSLEYDVVVIGAGFGGPVAAHKCARAGFRTLMIERSENPGEKVVSGLTIPVYGFLFGPDFIRDGNPPIERPVDGIINYIINDIDAGDIEIDDSMKIPKPFAPVVAFGYNAYCKDFCEWEARKAVDAGAELRLSTVVTGVLMDNGKVRGVLLETGEEIYSKIVIDAEGSQGLVAVKAGIREKYPPEAISLADIYDYEMPKDVVDRLFGYSLRFCWGWDEQKIAPPLGHGNGLMVWPYRESLHFMQDHCLRLDGAKVPNLRKRFDEYHGNITGKLPWWREEVEPNIALRARMWEGFEIYVGLDDRLRNMPNHADGIILTGDAAGLESTELCDGVPAAWISSGIAADVAIAALRKNDTSAAFLSRYDRKIRKHPLLQWSISGTNRFNLRYAQRDHDINKLRKYVHDGWGLGALGHVSTPLLRTLLVHVLKNPLVLLKWRNMFFRYYHNWHHRRFDDG